MCTAERTCLFLDGMVVDALAREILRTCAEGHFAVLAYVFMPDHVHLLVQGRDDGAAFKPLMKLTRQRTSLVFHRFHRRSLWQAGYFERVKFRATLVGRDAELKFRATISRP